MKEKKTKDLQERIRLKEEELKKQPKNKKRWMELEIMQNQMKNLLNKEIEWRIKQLRQKEFEGADKPGRLLAWQIKKKRQKKKHN